MTGLLVSSLGGRLSGPVALVRHERVWRRYFAARWVSVLGSTISPMAAAWAVIRIGGTATDLGIVLVGSPVVFMLLAQVAGVAADRYPRRTILIATQATSALIQAVAAALVLTRTANVPTLAVTQLALGAGVAFFAPAARGLLPQLVPADRLGDANAVAQLSNNGAAIVGPVLAGWVIAATDPGWVLAWDSVTFAASAALFASLRLPAVPRQARRSPFAEALAGWRVFLAARWLVAITALSAISSGLWAAGMTVLAPIYFDHGHGGAVTYGLVNTGMGVGFAAGSVTALLLRPSRAGLIYCAAMLPEAALFAAMAAAQPAVVIAVVAAVCGAGSTLQLIAWNTTLGLRIDGAQIGRVMAVQSLVASVLTPVGLVVAGPVTALIGMTVVMTVLTVVALAAAAAVISVREVRDLDSRTPEPAPEGVAV
jgi:MFS family permease